MKKSFIPLIILFFTISTTFAQQYGLFNSGTLFDAFENPAQKHFQVDKSRKFSSNFFLPVFGVEALHKGSADEFIRSLIQSSLYHPALLKNGDGSLNKISEHSNVYLVAFKLYHDYKKNKEFGVSWQVRTDISAKYPSEFIQVLDSYKNLPDQTSRSLFNSAAMAQSYFQFSASYRQDVDKQLSFGLKASLLSGLTYNNLEIQDSNFSLDRTLGSVSLGFTGRYDASFFYGEEVSRDDFTHLFRNPGLSLTAGFQYKTMNGYTLMGNIKDLGFIRWNRSGYTSNIFFQKTYSTSTSAQTIQNEIFDKLHTQDQNIGFFAPTNAKADVFITKAFGQYSPSVILSKNLFYPGGDLAMVNTYHLKDFSGSIIPAYNFTGAFLIGLQAMYKTPNFELYMGSDNAIKTIATAKATYQNDENQGKGYNGASFYMGIGIKFGRMVQTPMNSDYIPGLESERKRRNIIQRIFGN